MEEDGVTLIELMLIMVLASILLAVAVPAFTAFIQNNRLVTHANQLVSALNLARSEAIRRNMDVHVTRGVLNDLEGGDCSLVGEWSDGWVVWVDRPDEDDAIMSDDLDQCSEVLKAFEGLDSEAELTGGLSEVGFNSTGSAVAAACFDLELPGTPRTRRITLHNAGGIVTEKNLSCP